MNKNRFIIIFITLLIQINPIFSQNLIIKYNGYANSSNINGSEEYYYDKTSGGNIIYGCFEFPIPYSENVKHNSQSVSNAYIYSNYDYSNYEVIYNEEGIPRVKIEFEEDDMDYFFLEREYSASTSLNFPKDCFEDEFPITSSIPGYVQAYLEPSYYVQSNNPTLRNLAQSIVSNSYTMEDAVEKIAMWTRGNITYASQDSQDALTVYNRKEGNCRGFSHLIITLLRSVGIPARYSTGVILPHGYNVPYKSSGYLTLGDNGPKLHAFYEVYYPLIDDWVRGDGQTYVHHTDPNLIKFNHQLDQDNSEIKITLGYTGIPPTIDRGYDIGSYIGSVNSNYQYITEGIFGGSEDGKNLISAYRECITTGINDEVSIINGPDNFKTGESVYYEAEFTSGSGYTYPVNWS